MIFRIHCPSCRSPFDVDENLVGEKGLCPSCQTRFIITRPATADGRTTQPMNPSGADDYTPTRPVALPLFLAVLVGAGFGWLFWWSFQHYALGSGVKAPREFTVPGKLHPIILHLPIGFISAALILDIFTGRQRRHASAVSWLLWLSLLSSGAAALAGYYWAAGRTAFSEELEQHLWTGLAVPAGVFITLILNIIAGGHPSRSVWPYRLALFLTAGILSVAGHLGGKMTHGDPVGEVMDLVLKRGHAEKDKSGGSASVPAVNAPAPAAATYYQAVVAPILQARCVSCHGEEKQKGDFRLDSVDEMLKAGESTKPGVVPGRSAESHMITLMVLPAEDDEHMPPDNKPQPSPDEIEVLRWWIDAGASRDLPLADAGVPEAIRTKATAAAAAATRAP